MTVIATPTSFHKGTYAEALGLLRETKRLLSAASPEVTSDPAQRLFINAEYSRVASRLAHIVSWLMAQKAVQQGDATWHAMHNKQPPLAALDVCVDERSVTDEELPVELRELLARSHTLFTRVARIDEMTRNQHS
ncbi:MAG: DUF1465 family protein [Alphaproteobacteria bacterium]